MAHTVPPYARGLDNYYPRSLFMANNTLLMMCRGRNVFLPWWVHQHHPGSITPRLNYHCVSESITLQTAILHFELTVNRASTHHPHTHLYSLLVPKAPLMKAASFLQNWTSQSQNGGFQEYSSHAVQASYTAYIQLH